jgi:arylsulfatase A
MDDGIGRIRAELKRLNQEDNTLIIFMSDNGGMGMDQIAYRPTSMAPLRKWKGHVYEGGIRVPMIMCWKNKITFGSVNDKFA